MSAEFIVFVTSANINMNQFSNGEIDANLSLYLAWATQIIFLLFFIGFISYLWKNVKRLQDESIK